MNYNDLRRLKYHVVKNAYQDVKLAQRARNWSAEKIEQELGLKLPNRIPKLRKDVSIRTQKQKQLELKKFQYLRDELIKNNTSKVEAIKIASSFKKRSYDTVNQIIKSYSSKNKDGVIKVKPVDQWQEYMKAPKVDRIKQWSNWAKSGRVYPDEIKQLAAYYNNKKGLADDHHLGWAIVYQAFINNQDPNKLAKYFTVDTFLPEMYVKEVQVYYEDDVI